MFRNRDESRLGGVCEHGHVLQPAEVGGNVFESNVYSRLEQGHHMHNVVRGDETAGTCSSPCDQQREQRVRRERRL